MQVPLVILDINVYEQIASPLTLLVKENPFTFRKRFLPPLQSLFSVKIRIF